eukprot:275393-Amphidinium_carterae.1
MGKGGLSRLRGGVGTPPSPVLAPPSFLRAAGLGRTPVGPPCPRPSYQHTAGSAHVEAAQALQSHRECVGSGSCHANFVVHPVRVVNNMVVPQSGRKTQRPLNRKGETMENCTYSQSNGRIAFTAHSGMIPFVRYKRK